MKLYEIDRAILACLDEETGEILDLDALTALEMERETKLENIALYIKTLEAEAIAIKTEETALAKRRAVKENKAARLREFLVRTLDGQTMETARVRLSFRNSTAVSVEDEDTLRAWLEKNREDLLRYTPPAPNKLELLRLLKTGADIPGAKLETRRSLQIK